MHRVVRNGVGGPGRREAEINNIVAVVDELTGGIGGGVVERPPLRAYPTSRHTMSMAANWMSAR